MITVTVNEEPRAISPDSSVADLLQVLQIQTPAIAVEVNQELVGRDKFAAKKLTAGDVVEIVTLVGGG